MSDQPETLQIRLSRPDSGISWGFRLQGGRDFNTPLSIQVVQPRSIAERCGLRAGDGILQINNTNTDGLSHEEAKMEIIRSSNDIIMLVQRGAVLIWKPKVTPMSELRPQELQPIQTATGDQIQVSQKTSLAKDQVDQPCTIGVQYNRSARPFGSGGGAPQPRSPTKAAVPNVVHAQFNSPIGLYSADNIAKTYTDQTAGIQRQMSDLDVEGRPVGARMTGTYQNLDQDQGQEFGVPYSPTSPEPPAGGPSGFRSVSAPVAKPPGPSSEPKQQSMHCNGCGNLVTGVFVRVKGLPYHEKCFKCANCGLFLKQKGYFMIEGQLYCETHARRAAEAPGDNMRYAGAVYR